MNFIYLFLIYAWIHHIYSILLIYHYHIFHCSVSQGCLLEMILLSLSVWESHFKMLYDFFLHFSCTRHRSRYLFSYWFLLYWKMVFWSQTWVLSILTATAESLVLSSLKTNEKTEHILININIHNAMLYITYLSLFVFKIISSQQHSTVLVYSCFSSPR